MAKQLRKKSRLSLTVPLATRLSFLSNFGEKKFYLIKIYLTRLRFDSLGHSKTLSAYIVENVLTVRVNKKMQILRRIKFILATNLNKERTNQIINTLTMYIITRLEWMLTHFRKNVREYKLYEIVTKVCSCRGEGRSRSQRREGSSSSLGLSTKTGFVVYTIVV